MQRVYYRRQVVAARFFASLLCAAGLEMKEWKVKLKRQQKAYHSSDLPVNELA
ncbi:hypothetical protein M3650_04805 [Paenibacillus sp. MER TA 81-3]|uniref:hypothetical protein n=1 Tax=Paenibacillus sp. MER TA 81-3 TaxID=2939573 RepID=UPI00203A9EEA|nr:hypothetical protein [Paenibacillus sp. MER TA 81-3]MCM3337972.1 hypothetical protein [Paenibacillus sp. MER TA 81-3]